jgi:hypothetical protein
VIANRVSFADVTREDWSVPLEDVSPVQEKGRHSAVIFQDLQHGVRGASFEIRVGEWAIVERQVNVEGIAHQEVREVGPEQDAAREYREELQK